MFNSTSKNERKNLNIINQNHNKGFAKLDILVNDIKYTIERESEKYTKRLKGEVTLEAKTNVEFSAEDELEKLKAENEKLKTELAESPADAPINTNKFSSERPTPTAQDFRRMTSQEKFLYNLNK